MRIDLANRASPMAEGSAVADRVADLGSRKAEGPQTGGVCVTRLTDRPQRHRESQIDEFDYLEVSQT